jgi:hypothetical protein
VADRRTACVAGSHRTHLRVTSGTRNAVDAVRGPAVIVRRGTSPPRVPSGRRCSWHGAATELRRRFATPSLLIAGRPVCQVHKPGDSDPAQPHRRKRHRHSGQITLPSQWRLSNNCPTPAIAVCDSNPERLKSPIAVFCMMRHRLAAEYAAAVTRCDELLSARKTALLSDDFQAALTVALTWRDNAKLLLTSHRLEHG